jgi:hypothetical protein
MARKTLYERIVTVLGDILVYRWPMFLLYNPSGYRVKGEDVRELIDRIRPGDILVRGYDNYLDGRIIPGYFSHVGLYLGDVTQADADAVARVSQGLLPGGKPRVKTGKDMVIHALAEGVLTEDVINFCRCDYMAVLRLPARMTVAARAWKPAMSEDSFSAPERALRDRMCRGEAVAFDEALPLVRLAALGKKGRPYDFQFDFERMDRLSCTELVYFATKSLGPFLDVAPVNRRLLLFFRRSLIEPDAFVRAPLEVAWKSRSVDAARFERILAARSAPVAI